MPSPFPGMNPYLEQADAWEDFHGRFIVTLAQRLEPKVGDQFLVKMETRLYLHELPGNERGRLGGVADVGITGPEGEKSATRTGSVTAPVVLTLPSVEEEKYTWIEIRDRWQRKVVTTIEVLSPTNKSPGPDRDDYLTKRALLLAGPTHFVEIDLRRGGQRPWPPNLPRCDYYVLISRAEARPKLGCWPLSLRDSLPCIPIPLSHGVPDVSIDLQEILNAVYETASYAKYIYQGEPEPGLTEADQNWATSILRSAR